MRTYILFLIVFLFCASAYSQTVEGMRRGGKAGSGRTTGTQTMGSEGQRTGQKPSDRLRTKERRQGGECNPRGKGAGIGSGGSTGVRTRSGTETGISQPNIRTNTGVRSF